MPDLSAESRHPLSDGLHAVASSEVLSRILAGQTQALDALTPAFAAISKAARAGAQALRQRGKMAYAGAASSGLMALPDCLELPGTFGSTSHTGTTAHLAKARGVTVVGFANVASSPLLALADIAVFLDSGPEVISGSTRMGAETVQKIALNMLSVLVAIDLGHVHDGYMINVTADNAKLVKRAAQIVARVSGAAQGMALAALDETGRAVKPAILVAGGLSVAEAEQALFRTGGHLAPLITATHSTGQKSPPTGRRQ
mgnify:CR=1 FL=1